MEIQQETLTALTSKLPTLLLTLLITLLLTTATHLLHKLTKARPKPIPNAHWSAPFSPIWIQIARLRGRENGALLEAHRRLGDVVRVAPGTVSVDCVEGVRVVYGGFEKGGWYSVFGNYGTPNMFSSCGSKPHAARKRMLSNTYSKSHIAKSPIVNSQTADLLKTHLLPLLDHAANARAPVEVQRLFLSASMDSISSFVYGRQGTKFLGALLAEASGVEATNGGVENGRVEGHEGVEFVDRWFTLYNARNEHHFWPQEFPRLTSFLKRLGIWLYPKYVDFANGELERWNWELFTRAAGDDSEREQGGDESASVYDALVLGIDREEKQRGSESAVYDTVLQRKDEAIASELMDHLLAGHETSGITLTYLAYRLSQNPTLQILLRQELLTLRPVIQTRRNHQAGEKGLPSPTSVDNLPLLHAIVMETLRLHAPIPGPQPRVVPNQACTISGYEIPGGTRVAALAYTLHRDEEVFPEPGTWDPMRWMDMPGETEEEVEERRKEMMRRFWAFGSGGRMCIGSNFAIYSMKYIVAAIYTNFTTSIFNDDGIEQGDGYTARPAKDRLFLRFSRVGKLKEGSLVNS